MANKTKTELKKIAQRGLELKYGFAPTLNKINLLEAQSDGTYIMFHVNGIVYKFDSYTIEDGSVWVDGYRVNRYGEIDV